MPRRQPGRPAPAPPAVTCLLSALVVALVTAPAGAATVHKAHAGPPPARQDLALREVWRAGGEDEASVLLGQVGVVASGPGGEVYALDSQLAQVQVFGPGGEHRRTLGREGEGPGEFRQPVGLFLTDAGTVAVQQAFPGKITYLDPQNGTPVGSWQYGQDDPQQGGFAFVEGARKRGGTFVVSGTTAAFDMAAREIRNTSFFAVVDPAGGEVARLSELSTTRSLVQFTIDELAEYNPGDRGRWDVGPGGRLYYAPRYDAYEIAVVDGAGQPVLTIGREDYQARLRTEQEKEAQRGSMQINVNGQVPQIDWKLQDREPAIARLRVLDDGTLWVQHSHSEVDWAEHGRMTYDVFGPGGDWLREVAVTVPGGGEGDRLVLLDDGRFVLIKGMESLSISVSAGDGDDVEPSDEALGDVLLELVCLEPVR